VKYLDVVVIAAGLLAVRVAISRKRRGRRSGRELADGTGGAHQGPGGEPRGARGRIRGTAWDATSQLGDVALIARREIRERVRGRIFRVGTLLVLVAVAGAIIIPKLHSSSGPTPQTVGVVGGLAPQSEHALEAAGAANGDSLRLVPEASLAAADSDLRAGKIDFAIVDSDRIVLDGAAGSKSSAADPSLVRDVAGYLGLVQAYRAARLSPAQAGKLEQAHAVPVQTLQASSKGAPNTTSVIGLVLLFVMLTQYNTWILIGVMQEKSSRVVEVLLATVRPIQLLGGKVLGIGLVALGQAALIVVFALVVAAAVGSDLLHGAAPLVLADELLWLVLGYGFYCWVYAAAGSTAERQDQVQTLALPLSVPILIGYVFSITVASTGNADLLFKVLAYLPPTAPFCMSVLVGLGAAAWWQVLASALITIGTTAGVAVLAAGIYRRAVLRTGGRVPIRELFARTAD
jgi:ABC-2 type transport system permease protein